MLSPGYRILVLSLLLIPWMDAASWAQQTLGELFATDASVKGAVILAGSGTSVLSGSSIEAGAQLATLKLERGGSLLVCSGTTLSINASRNGRALLFSLNSGNLEMNYPLGAAADTLLTPDLHLLMSGPGTVHVAVRVGANGDTCVQPLPANTTAIVVSETMSDATYQLKPDDAVVFQGGHINGALPSRQHCGCPAPPPAKIAKAPAPPPPQSDPPKPAETVHQPLAMNPADQHLAVEAPFVFRAADPAPDLGPLIATLKLEQNKVLQFEPVVAPPTDAKNTQGQATSAVAQKEPKHNFFSRVGSFFSSLLH